MSHPLSLLFSLVVAMALAVPLARSATAADATPLLAPQAVTGADRLANLHAQRDVSRAFAEIPAGGRREALARLEGTEITLLDRQAGDLDPLLQTDRSSAVAELDQARVDVLDADAQQAREAASDADQAIDAERGAHNRPSGRRSETTGKEN